MIAECLLHCPSSNRVQNLSKIIDTGGQEGPLVSHYLSHLYDIHKTISAIITTKNIQADWDGDTIMTRITGNPVVGP